MIEQRLKNLLKNKHCTLLGVGPMSKICVDATIELANYYEVPILMIASRRQIDSKEFGGGYVNNWDTDAFAHYVGERDKKGKILLARDHGGPWQSPKEVNSGYSLKRAMESAKASFNADIEAGFQVIHIDPSVDIHGTPDVNEILDRIFELYDYCWSRAKQLNKEIIFEIGTEEQSGSTNTQEELDYTLNSIMKFCDQNKFSRPTFVVVQCGTKVMEMRNVGSFDSALRVANEIPAEIQLPKMIEICNNHKILMKEHNTDYLSNDALRWHPRLGIHAANVAPEFGVAETKELVNILNRNKLDKILDKFLEISYESRKWEKWMIQDTKSTDFDKSIISGHYVFSNKEVIEIIHEAKNILIKKNIDLNLELKQAVKTSIMRYLTNFRLVSKI